MLLSNLDLYNSSEEYDHHYQEIKNELQKEEIIKREMNSGRGGVMPLELAMQRELAYRKKVDMLLQQLHGGVSRRNPVSSSSSRPNSSPHSSGVKRKTPTSSFNYQQHQMLQPRYDSHALETQTNDLFCKVCQVPCSGPDSLKQHLQGQKHWDRLQNLTPSTNIGEEGASPETRTNDLFCNVCQVPCAGPKSLKQHLQGRKHRDRLQNMTPRTNTAEEGAKQRLWCGLCKIWCVNEISLEDHLKGQKHRSRAQMLELHGANGGETANQNKYCNVCKIWCTNAFNQHLKSERHIFNLNATKGKKMVLEDN